jgi:hypothetical protein
VTESIRREDLTFETADINPDGRELSYEEGDLLDEFLGDTNMNLVTSVMDIIVDDMIKKGVPQKAILAFFQWNINSMWRYVDLHDHALRGEVSVSNVALEGDDTMTIKYHCGTPACDPPTTEEE